MTTLPSHPIGWLYTQLAKALITTTLTKNKIIAAVVAKRNSIISAIIAFPLAPIIQELNIRINLNRVEPF